MKEFFLRAWNNPKTTFGLGGAICVLIASTLSDGQPWSALKGVKLVGEVMGLFGALAASDAITPPAPPSAPSASTPS